ncbi:peptidoglycan-binding domain-containing protein [Streptomyces sp. NPDC005336]|uniref:peptidoglycan-binding domain-containing protein n=1 Tax=unclassified Streptomyces TaxID=2593676 RepID=UPI0033B83940
MTAESCPHCFAPARANGRPGCECAARAAAAASAAGDTDDQIHLRPYVTLVTLSEESATSPDPGDDRLFADADETQAIEPLDRIDPIDRGEKRRDDRPDGGDGADDTPPADHADDKADVDDEAEAEDAAPGSARHRKSKRKAIAIVVAGAAAVAVAGSLAIGTGLLGGANHKDDAGEKGDRTLSDTRTSAPAADDDKPAEDTTAPGGASPSATADTAASGSARPSAIPSGSAAPIAAPASASASATRPAAEPKPTEPTGSPSSTPESPEPTGPPVLREGDSGAEVAELQKRLTQLLMYLGAADGKYDDGVKDAVSSYQDRYDVKGDPDGVYGENTRRDLESRTDEP